MKTVTFNSLSVWGTIQNHVWGVLVPITACTAWEAGIHPVQVTHTILTHSCLQAI